MNQSSLAFLAEASLYERVLNDLAYIWKLCAGLSMGLKYTLGLFFITAVLSLPFGLALALLRNSRVRGMRGAVNFYVWLLRGTPLLLQLFFVYFGLPNLPFVGKYLVFSRFPAACIAFVLNYAAYFCEIFRGGLLSVDIGQHEAARVLGLSRAHTLFRVVMPQMLRISLPAISNECITLVKDTALVISISVTEVLFFAKNAVNRDVNATAYGVAAVFFLLMNVVLTYLFRYLEKRTAF